MPEQIVVVMAMSRLDYLLAEGRESLEGKFSEQEMNYLLDAYNGTIFSTYEITHLASGIADFQGIESYEQCAPDFASFMRKLCQLSLVEKHALADVIERFWHAPPAKLGDGFGGFAEKLGLRLAD